MSEKFRNSLFGFNKDDVITFTEKLKIEYEQSLLNQKTLNDNLKKENDELNSKLAIMEKSVDVVANQNAELLSELNALKAKKEEIDTLSESIGRLYLISKTNAKTIMNAAKQKVEISSSEVDKNFECVDELQNLLSALRSKLNETTSVFNNSVTGIETSLGNARKVISVIDEKIEERHDEVFNALSDVSADK